MIAECWTIVAVLVMMSLLLLRREKRAVSLALLPLVIVPLVHISAGPIVRLLIQRITLPFHFLVIAVDGIGLVIACITIGVVGAFVKSKKIRWFYFLTCGGFSVILNWVLLYNTIGRLL